MRFETSVRPRRTHEPRKAERKLEVMITEYDR